jgi:LacI family transcriptional regulator, galactose operon repressor
MDKIIKEIALAFPMGVQHLERLVFGLHSYSLEHQLDWQWVTSPDTHSLPVSALQGWDGDAVIGMINTDDDIRVLSNLHCPIINISGVLEHCQYPRIRLHYHAAGQMAAHHFLDKGFQNFAFYGISDVWYSQQLHHGFAQTLQSHSANCDVFITDSSINQETLWQHDTLRLEHWLQSLPAKTGVLAAHDPRAAMLIRACHRIKRNVPEDIAVIGMNNDSTTCEFSTPTLTSIARNSTMTGYKIGELLNRMMNGEEIPPIDIVVAPDRIVERSSTRTLAINNKDLEAAVDYIHNNIEHSFSVETLCQTLRKSRRWLEYVFQQELSTTPHQFISKARTAHAKKLLTDPKRYKLKQVALMSGFSTSKQLNIVFERITGITPREYREKALHQNLT